VLHGDDLLTSFSTRPRPAAPVQQVLFIGNSQQYTISLPKGVPPDPSRKVPAAAELFGRALDARQPGAFAVYDVPAPSQNFVEALWQGVWWYHVEAKHPSALVLESSFDAFRMIGVRPGFQTLLHEPAFASALDDLLGDSPGSWAGVMEVAKHDFEARVAELAKNAQTSFGVEAFLRRMLEHVPLYHERDTLRTELLEALYYARVRMLNVSPTSQRHINGPPLTANFEALERLIAIARADGAEVLIYNAPENPAVQLYFSEEYADYLTRLQRLVKEHGARFIDLANAIPAEQWGYWVDRPDPVHVDEQGHVTLARLLDEAWGPLLTARGG
jgi:hypothetical protein